MLIFLLSMLLTVLILALIGVLMFVKTAPQRREGIWATELADGGRCVAAEVVSLERKRMGGDDWTEPMKMALRYTDEASNEQHATVHAYITKELISNFTPGKTVYVRYDPANPERMAIDRERSPTRIAWTTHARA
jgi:hypothetical protein